MKKNDYDAVILSWDAHYLSLYPALFMAKRARIPVALWGHGYSKRGHGLRDHLRNWYGKQADAVLLYSHKIAHELIQSGYAENRVFVAQNAIDQIPIKQARKKWLAKPLALLQFQMNHELDPTQTIIFMSRMEPDNKLDILIEGFAKFMHKRKAAKLVLIGDGPDRARLEFIAKRSGRSSSIIFTGAIYNEYQIAPWMMSATVFCYPANIGLSVLHAFGYGLPVVTNDDLSSHNPEIEAIVHRKTGLLFKQGDIGDMFLQCEKIIDDPELRSRISINAYQAVNEKYTLDVMVEGFVKIARFLVKN